MILKILCVALVSYLLGSFSAGITVSRWQHFDIRTQGSKNSGASNVLRVMGPKWGAITFFLDSAKAALACLLSLWFLPGSTFGVERFGILLAGLFAIIGHNWPIYYGFRGGKGVACSVTVVLFANPLLGGISVALCLLVIALTRFISLGSLTLLFSFMVLNLIFNWGQWVTIGFCVILFAMCAYRHHANIRRLLRGEERKIGQKEARKP